MEEPKRTQTVKQSSLSWFLMISWYLAGRCWKQRKDRCDKDPPRCCEEWSYITIMHQTLERHAQAQDGACSICRCHLKHKVYKVDEGEDNLRGQVSTRILAYIRSWSVANFDYQDLPVVLNQYQQIAPSCHNNGANFAPSIVDQTGSVPGFTHMPRLPHPGCMAEKLRKSRTSSNPRSRQWRKTSDAHRLLREGKHNHSKLLWIDVNSIYIAYSLYGPVNIGTEHWATSAIKNNPWNMRALGETCTLQCTATLKTHLLGYICYMWEWEKIKEHSLHHFYIILHVSTVKNPDIGFWSPPTTFCTKRWIRCILLSCFLIMCVCIYILFIYIYIYIYISCMYTLYILYIHIQYVQCTRTIPFVQTENQFVPLEKTWEAIVNSHWHNTVRH